MSASVLVARFLTAMAQSISTRALYKGEHPAVRRASDAAYDALLRLREVDPKPVITFLGDEIIYERRPLRELKRWDWGGRLSDVGIERLEFVLDVTEDEFERFLDDVYRRLTDQDLTSEARTAAATPIRFGSVGLKGGGGTAAEERERQKVATLDLGFQEEAQAVKWMHDEVERGADIHIMEADAIVRSLSVALHASAHATMPLLMLREFDEYTTTHAINVSILSMGLAEALHLDSKAVRQVGISGLLHDIGKVKIPDEILNKAGKLTDAERGVMEAHPVEGARILLERQSTLDLAAVVAYEHHVRQDGGGYPKRTYQRACHPVSDLVHICDIYDALRTHRPYRAAWEHARVLDYLAEKSGDELDGELVHTFTEMMKAREQKAMVFDRDQETLIDSTRSDPTGTSAAGPSERPGEPVAVGSADPAAVPVSHVVSNMKPESDS